MEERGKSNNDISIHANQKKVYQNPFKRDNIYKTSKIKSKQLPIFKKENLSNISNRKQKVKEIYKGQNNAKKKLKSYLSINNLNNSNGNILNFNKVILTKEPKTLLNKNKNKNIYGNSTKLIFKKNNRKSINVESSLNILNEHKFSNKSNLHNGIFNQIHKNNISIDLINNINNNYSQNEKNKYHSKTNNNTIKNKNNKYNNNDKSLKNHKNFNSDENILINKFKKKIKISDNFNNNKDIKTKANEESKEILLLSSKKTTEDIIKGLNSTMKGNNKSANTKPTNISSFVVSEKNIELDDNFDSMEEKIKRNNIFKNSIFKEHMKFVNLNSNQPNFILYDNYNMTKENESKFLNYELGLTNGLSGTDSLLWEYNNINQNEKNKSKLIELEHPLEYMEKMAHEILESHKNLPKLYKDKEDGRMKDNYYEMTDNNISNIDEMKKGENIHRIINLQINMKK